MTRVQRSVSDPCRHRSFHLSRPGSGSWLWTLLPCAPTWKESASIDCYKAITRQAVQKTQQQFQYEANFIGELLYILHLVHRCLRMRTWLIFKTEVKTLIISNICTFTVFQNICLFMLCWRKCTFVLSQKKWKEMWICAFWKETRICALPAERMCIRACEKKCTFTLRWKKCIFAPC